MKWYDGRILTLTIRTPIGAALGMTTATLSYELARAIDRTPRIISHDPSMIQWVSTLAKYLISLHQEIRFPGISRKVEVARPDAAACGDAILIIRRSNCQPVGAAGWFASATMVLIVEIDAMSISTR